LNGLITDHPHHGAVRPKSVSYNYLWRPVTLHRFAPELQCCLTTPSFHDMHLKNIAFMINGAPKVVSFAVYPHEDFIKMPSSLDMGTH
jgi:hypothetical protein